MVGFSFNYVNDEENERLGFRRAWVGQLGTLREGRNRGVASTLLCRSMSLFRAAGMDYAVLGVDTENLTGALALYERVGFKAVSRVQSLSKPVLP